MDQLDHESLVARTPETAPYWLAASDHKLVLPLCESCDRYHWFPRAFCPHCHGVKLRWVESPGRGRIHSFSTMHRARPVEVVALVSLSEGVTIFSRIRTDQPEALKIDMEVEAIFETVEGVKNALVFGPVGRKV